MGQGEERLLVRTQNGSFLPQRATQCMGPRQTTWNYGCKNLIICAYIWLPKLSGPALKAKATKPQTSLSTCLLTLNQQGAILVSFLCI